VSSPYPYQPYPQIHSPRRPPPPEAWQPRPYTQLLRGPAHRWWFALVGLAIALAGLLVVVGVSTVAVVVATVLGVVDAADLESSLDDWWMLLLTNLGLAALIPISVLAVWGGHRWRPRWVSSVAGGLRWRWLVVSAGACLLVAGATTAVTWALGGLPTGTGRDVAVLLLVVALTTPLQAAGEEYLFRGWLAQAIGSLFARAVLGAVVAALVSAALFALAHGSQNPWLFLDRFAFGLLASYLVWRTGGLEAAIAAHTVNNVVVFVPTILTGGLAAALTVTDVPATLVLLDIASMVALGATLVWLARRTRVQRFFVPASPPPAPAPGGAGGPVLAPPGHLG
jgi:membrane protease YdiL (CAAX protease family)